MKESKSNICFQCEEQEELLPDNTICVYCDELNRKNDFLSGNIEINKNNLHLYYKFISNEDLEKYSLILNDVFMDRYIFIYKELFEESSLTYPYFLVKKTTQIYNIDGGLILKSFVLDVQDILKPIHEYLKEIKQSLSYQNYLQEKSS